MKSFAAIATLAVLAGCATTENTQVAALDCKVVPMTIHSATGVRKPNPDSLDQRYAEMQLASSDYRYRQLRERGMVNNTVEDALRDCNR